MSTLNCNTQSIHSTSSNPQSTLNIYKCIDWYIEQPFCVLLLHSLHSYNRGFNLFIYGAAEHSPLSIRNALSYTIELLKYKDNLVSLYTILMIGLLKSMEQIWRTEDLWNECKLEIQYWRQHIFLEQIKVYNEVQAVVKEVFTYEVSQTEGNSLHSLKLMRRSRKKIRQDVLVYDK